MDNDSRFAANIESDAAMPEIKMEPAVIREAPVREAPKVVVKERRVAIILEENDNVPPLGQFFGHNGVGYMLKSNMEALVPWFILDILNNAVIDKPIIDPDTKQVTGWRKQLRFPYRVVATVEPAVQPAQAAA